MKKFIIILISVVILCKNLFSLGYLSETYRLLDNSSYDGGLTLFSNPAGLWNTEVPEMSFSYNLLYPNLTDKTKFVNNTAIVVNKMLSGGVGFGFNQFGVEGWYIKDRFVLSYGKDMKELLKNLKLGMKLSYENERYTLDEYIKDSPVFKNGNQKSYFSISLGGIYYLNENNVIALTIENINQPDTGLLTTDTLPLEINFGYKFVYDKLKVYPSLKIENSVKTDYTFGLGFEYDIFAFKKIKFSPSLALGFGSRSYSKSIFGFSIKTSQISFSYCFDFDFGDKPTQLGAHYISLSYKFLLQPISEEKISKKEYLKLLTEKQQLQKQLEEIKKQKVVVVSSPTVAEEKSTSVEQMLLEKLKELEERLKETERRKVVEEKRPPSPTTTVVPTTPPTPKKRYHTVVEGDTLPKLAERYYGDKNQWKKIYDANKDKIIRGQLLVGTVLEIP